MYPPQENAIEVSLSVGCWRRSGPPKRSAGKIIQCMTSILSGVDEL
jgi:hypothetical protein